MVSTGTSTRAAVIASGALMIVAAAAGSWLLLRGRGTPEAESAFTGSSACRGCHEAFYEKWATSWHGMALRPCTPILSRETFTPMPAPLTIGDRSWRFETDRDGGVLVERGPGGEKAWPIAHVLGGKNVIYLLTPFPGGRLQVMPLAYDTRLKEWYDSAGSMVRHFRSAEDAPVDWKDRALTFNTSCYSCHVSQLDRGYSFETDTYRTTWGEPGINCEACHFTGLPARGGRQGRGPEGARAPGDHGHADLQPRPDGFPVRHMPCEGRCRWTRASCRERDSSTTPIW